MSNIKIISGMLCRDTNGNVVFIRGKRKDVRLLGTKQRKVWIVKTESKGRFITSWTYEQWKAEYNFRPPHKGKCYKVRMEV